MDFIFKNFRNASPGERLTYLRRSLCPNRRVFANKHSINLNTLVAWERNQNKISKKGLEKIITAFNQEGILCSGQWILYGKGTEPMPIDDFSQKQISIENSSFKSETFPEESDIKNEAYLFTSNNASSELFKAQGDGMEPYIFENDLLGVIPVHCDHYDEELGKVCVSILSDDPSQHYVRLLLKGKGRKKYNLCSTNLLSKETSPVIFNTEIEKLYKIVWLRRKK